MNFVNSALIYLTGISPDPDVNKDAIFADKLADFGEGCGRYIGYSIQTDYHCELYLDVV